jgi:hypothetical protein
MIVTNWMSGGWRTSIERRSERFKWLGSLDSHNSIVEIHPPVVVLQILVIESKEKYL